MEFQIKRIDHLGIVAGLIKDLKIVETIDDRLGRDDQEILSSGDIVSGMILNGLGFVSRPLMLTPQFFENKPLDILIKPGIDHTHLNRHKIGRVLDEMANYGNEKLFHSVALLACEKENIDMQFAHCDTLSYSLTGEYDSDSDTETIKITHGHSKDLRPDLAQVVQELITTQDGGIPFYTKSWDGNASDSTILHERVSALMEAFEKSKKRCFVADSKLYSSKTAHLLDKIYFITRVPSTLKREQEIILQALTSHEPWMDVEKGYKLKEFFVDHFNIENQRWIVVHSEQASERSKKTIKKEVDKEQKKIQKELFHLQAQRFECEADAKKSLEKITKKWKYHTAIEVALRATNRHAKRGRPTEKNSQKKEWQITAKLSFNQAVFDDILNQRSCFVLATNMHNKTTPMDLVLANYKEQDKVEKSFQFIKSPEFFTSSLFLKKPSRIESLLTIMVLSLLVYSIAQRRLRKALEIQKETIPNQINKPTNTPTMRWVFQLFEGINELTIVNENGFVMRIIDGISELRQKIINLLGPSVQKIYQFSGGWG